mmetsp:Transcript_2222/g.4503  ORF Transcript_2222/g.4503 Transcript_2222/m.4503 type:complete len:334 (-) Transcript_2222:306-1307(-)
MVLPNGKPTLSASSNFLEEPSPEDKTLPKAWGWLPEPSREMLRAWRCARLPTRLCIELCTSGGGVPLTEDRSGEGAELSLRYPTLAALARTGSPSPMGGSGPSVDDSSRLEVVGERLTPWVGSSMLMFASGLSSSVRGGRSSLGKLAAGPPAKPLFGVEGDTVESMYMWSLWLASSIKRAFSFSSSDILRAEVGGSSSDCSEWRGVCICSRPSFCLSSKPLMDLNATGMERAFFTPASSSRSIGALPASNMLLPFSSRSALCGAASRSCCCCGGSDGGRKSVARGGMPAGFSRSASSTASALSFLNLRCLYSVTAMPAHDSSVTRAQKKYTTT